MQKVRSFFFCLLMSSVRGDFYEDLGVNKRATTAEIKKGYKKMLKMYHPDNNKKRPEWAKKGFLKISRAYEVLSDEKKRKLYDMGGEEMVNNGEQAGRGRGGGQGGSAEQDIFNMFFGGGGSGGFNFGGSEQRGNSRGMPGGFNFEGFGQRRREPQKPKNSRPKIDFSAENNIIILDDETKVDFSNLRENWTVYLYNPETRDTLNSQWIIDFSQKYGENLKIAVINCSTSQKLCSELSPQRLPELQIRTTRNRRVLINLIPNLSKEFVVQQNIDLMEKRIQRVNTENYVSFNRENTGTPVLLVFTKRSRPSLLILSIANILQGQVTIAEVDDKDPLTERFGVKKFPSIGLLEDAASYSIKWIDGELKKRTILSFIDENLLTAGKQGKKDPTRLTRENLNFGACGSKDATFCIIPLINKDNVSSYVDRLKQLSEKYSKDPVSFYYIEKDDLNLESWKENFRQGQMIIIRGKRGKAMSLNHELLQTSVDEIQAVLDNLLGGNVQEMFAFSKLESLFK